MIRTPLAAWCASCLQIPFETVVSGKFRCIVAFLLTFGSPCLAEPVVVVSPFIDRTDRIDEILRSASPPISVQRVFLQGPPKKPASWYRMLGDRRPVALRAAKLLILENAPTSGLERTTTDRGRPLIDAIPGWVADGGRLLVMGGWPSQEAYGGTALGQILPAKPTADPGHRKFKQRILRPLSGAVPGGLSVEHLHPVSGVAGDVLIWAGDQPFAVRRQHGKGEILQLLGGDQAALHNDGNTRPTFFTTSAWSDLLLQFAGKALGTSPVARVLVNEEVALPAVRVGAVTRVADWFDKTPVGKKGQVRLVGPQGTTHFRADMDSDGKVRLPVDLRPGVYQAHFRRGRKDETTRIRVGLASDPSQFDIRYFAMGQRPNPLGRAPLEAYRRGQELEAAGVTSVVYAATKKRPKNDLRMLFELVAAKLEIVYYSTTRYRSGFPRWRYGGKRPAVARDHRGKEVGWDIHDPAYREGMGRIFDGFEQVQTLPGLRALQMIEELRDADLQGPTLRKAVRSKGLRGDEKLSEPDWFRHEKIRSELTGETMQRYREVGHLRFPDVRQAGYWPASYWRRRAKYSLQVPAMASAIDELLGPGYGYNYSKSPQAGWTSVVDSAAEIFSAMNHRVDPGRGLYVYALGRPLSAKGAEGFELSAWTETAWTALAHGATGLAYFGMPTGEALADLGKLHKEAHRIGPWLAAAPRRPARVAVLASWTTRTTGTDEEAKTHEACVGARFSDLAVGFEEVDYILEGQLADPPANLKGLVVSSVPRMTDATVADVLAFVANGGHLFVEEEAARLDERGSPRRSPWASAQSSGRVHSIGRKLHCNPARPSKRAGREWHRQLKEAGIRPTSHTPAPFTEARLLGGDGLYYWILLNHGTAPATLKARASLRGGSLRWRDLRARKAVSVKGSGDVHLQKRVPGRDAVVLVGASRPAALLEMTVIPKPHQVEVTVRAVDEQGQPVVDGYPVRLVRRAGEGVLPLPQGAESRVIEGGIATWRVPVPVGEDPRSWRFQATEPIADRQATGAIPPLVRAEPRDAG